MFVVYRGIESVRIERVDERIETARGGDGRGFANCATGRTRKFVTCNLRCGWKIEGVMSCHVMSAAYRWKNRVICMTVKENKMCAGRG